jgi:hypothetical protein
MKNYSILSLPIALVSLIGSCVIAFLSLALTVANSLVPGLMLPNSYYQALNFPLLSVLLPAVGITVLLPIALNLAFQREAPATVSELMKTENQAITADENVGAHLPQAA